MNLSKIFIVSALAVSLSFGSAFAETQYKTASPFVRFTTNLFGYNFFAKKIAQGVLKKTLKKSVDGEYKVKFDSFSGVDLKKGKFRGLTIDGENLSIDDHLFISNLHMETTSDFNYVEYNKEPMVFKTDVPFKYNIEVTEEDLNKSFDTGEVFDTISSLIPLVKIEKPSLNLENGKLKISSSFKFPFAKPVKFSMSAGLKVVDGKIVMSDVKSSQSGNEFVKKLINLMNKNDFLENLNLNIIDGADTVVKVENVDIKSKKLYVNGQFIIKKSV